MAQTKAQLIDGKGAVDLGALSISGSAPDNSVNLDSSGRLLVGTNTSTNNIRVQERFAVVDVGTGTIGGVSFTSYCGANPDGRSILDFQRSRGTTDGSLTAVASGDLLGSVIFRGADGTQFIDSAIISAQVDGTPGANDMPGRLTFLTTADGTSAAVERMRIDSSGNFLVGFTSGSYHRIGKTGSPVGTILLAVEAGGGDHLFQQVNNTNYNAANTGLKLGVNNTTSRSLNAGGTVNASGADYAEYMVKAGNFDIAKGAVCGVTADGLLTLDYADAVSFVVKSTNPSYVGGDTWGSEEAVGPKPDPDDTDALTQWEADLEAARQKVDRIAFAGQVPVSVMGATPGQYIVPVETADGGIEGIAKNEADLTLAEYMRAVGKVIAIEDDGRARIIVKVA